MSYPTQARCSSNTRNSRLDSQKLDRKQSVREKRENNKHLKNEDVYVLRGETVCIH